MKEPIYRKQCRVTYLDTDCFDRCKPSSLLAFAQSTAGEHCELLGAGWELLQKRGLFWAVIRHRMQITRLPGDGEQITVETWPMPSTAAAFPRSTVAYDEKGSEVFRAVSLWALMDSESRALVLPGKSGVQVEGALLGSELAVPRGLMPLNAEESVLRRVQYSQLDRNLHMNNARYLDWVCDLLPAEFHKDHPIRDFTVCYISEAREGQAVALGRHLTDDGVLQVDARSESGDRVFSAQVQF